MWRASTAFRSLIFTRAAGAICGMVNIAAPAAADAKPIIAASMFGNTTEAVDMARAALDAKGLRGAGLPRHRRRRQNHGVARARGAGGRRAGHHHHRVGRHHLRRRLRCRAGAAQRARRHGRAPPDCARLRGHGQLRRHGDRAPEVQGRRPPLLRVEPLRHPHAHQRRGKPAHGRDLRREGQRRQRPCRLPHPAARRLHPGRRRRSSSRTAPPTRPCSTPSRPTCATIFPLWKLDYNINDPEFAAASREHDARPHFTSPTNPGAKP